MEDRRHRQVEYPLFLKVLLSFGILFMTSLGMILLSMLMSMFGFAYQIPNIGGVSLVLEQIGVVMLAASIVLGGSISLIGMTLQSISPKQNSDESSEKQKNESSIYDIRDHGLSVEDVLADMTMTERELLAENLARSRLAIREDGVLIPIEQAEKLQNIERFSNG